MICPFCHNKGWVPTPDFKEPVIQITGPEHYEHGTYRKHTCLNCKRSFQSIQTLDKEIKVGKDQMDLFAVKQRMQNG